MSEVQEVKEGFIEVGGKQYKIVKSGRAHAEQVVLLTRWLGAYGPALLEGVQGSDEAVETTGVGMITTILSNVTSDALIDLFQVLIGCNKKDAEKYFDVGILVEVALDVYENQAGIRRLIDRFFSTEESIESTEDSSTKLEESTDTPTTKS